MNPVRVTAAVITRNEKILLARRSEKQSQPLKWEFPGGKVEPGEDDEKCLIRELDEELGIKAKVGNLLGIFPYTYEDIQIELVVFFACIISGNPSPHEHAELVWCLPDQILNYELAAADIPVANILAAEGRIQPDSTMSV